MSTPTFRIEADGADITAQISDRLDRLTVTDEAGQKSDALEIRLDDRDRLLQVPASGTWLRLYLGYDRPVYVGAYAVDEVEVTGGPRVMTIKATAANTAPELLRELRTKSWHDTTLREIAEQIATTNGLRLVEIQGAGAAQIKHEDQTNESDQAFLTRLAERYKVTAKPADGALVLAPRGSGVASPAPAGAGRVSAAQAVGLARQAGFSGQDAITMGAIAMAESSGNARAHNPRPPDNSYGLWQINMLGSMGPARRAQLGISSNEALFDPATNARAARAIWQQQGFRAWSTYTSGAYKGYLKAAQSGAGTAAAQPASMAIGGAFTVAENECTRWTARLKNRGAYGQVKARWIDRTTNTEKVATQGQAGPAPAYEERQVFRSQADAEAAASSRLQSLRSGEVSINLEMAGRPDLNAEGTITLSGFRPEVDGSWNIRRVTHTVDGSGFRTSVEAGTLGDENNDWASGSDGPRGRNNGLPPSEKAQVIAGAAESARGMNTSGGPSGGNNACLWAVNRVLRRAGVTPPWGGSTYVPTARASLAAGAGTLLSGPEPGAIAIMRDNGNPPYPHIGVVGNDGRTIISNSSSRASFSWAAGESSYTSTYGRTPEYWRLK
jgi:phage protein D